MPFINGRYYANPVFGWGVELGRIIAGHEGHNSGAAVMRLTHQITVLLGMYRPLVYTPPRSLVRQSPLTGPVVFAT